MSEPAGEAPVDDAQERMPALFAGARGRLSFVERANISLVRGTFSSSGLNALMGWCQRVPGAGWVELCTRQLRHVHGADRLPSLPDLKRFILVANHRSYFDLFVCSMLLYERGLTVRMAFPVRSTFFYDHPLGLTVNGLMSWWSMYPPIFRDRKKLALNHIAMNELAKLVTEGELGAGLHPEGTRNKTDDPYTLLPAQSGVGRLIHQARVPVIPVFINGLTNTFVRQIASNFTRRGERIVVVFGAPIDFGTLLDEPGRGRTFRKIAEKARDVLTELGQEERQIRAALAPHGQANGG